MGFVCTRSRVKVLDTGIPDGLLCMKNQLLKPPVVVRLFNVYIPRFPISHDDLSMEQCDKPPKTKRKFCPKIE